MSFLTKDISSSSSSSSSSSCLVAMCIVDGDLPHATPEHKSIGGGGGQMDGRHRLQTSSPLPPLFYTIGSSIADRKSQHFYPLGWSGWWSFIKLHLKQLSDNHRLRIRNVGHFSIAGLFPTGLATFEEFNESFSLYYNFVLVSVTATRKGSLADSTRRNPP